VKFITPADRAVARKEKPVKRHSGRPARRFRPDIEDEPIWEPTTKYHYILLKCGHVTTPETVEATATWKPEKGKEYCEVCGKWREKVPPPKPVKYPDEPMF
jgi:hypothetical protein